MVYFTSTYGASTNPFFLLRRFVMHHGGICDLFWLIGVVVCLLAAPQVQLFVSVGSGWPHDVLWYHWLMPICYHLWDCKALLVKSLTGVSSASTRSVMFTTLPFLPVSCLFLLLCVVTSCSWSAMLTTTMEDRCNLHCVFCNQRSSCVVIENVQCSTSRMHAV